MWLTDQLSCKEGRLEIQHVILDFLRDFIPEISPVL